MSITLWMAGSFGSLMPTDPTNPSLITTLSVTRPNAVEVSGYHVYVTGDSGLYLFNILDPRHPVEEGYFPDGGIDLAISGEIAYQPTIFCETECVSGLQLISVSDPSNPQEIGFYKTNSFPGRVYVSDRYAYLAGKELFND